jgi:DNA invertase Pin-like site-specific DNA recombinase
LKAAVYLRMSTDKQEDSPERQRKAIEAYMAANGMKLYQEYVDEAERGWDKSRSGFQALLKDAFAGKFQAIVVDECSRLSRTAPLAFMGEVAYPLQQSGVELHSVAEGGLQNWDDDNLPGVLLSAVYQDQSRSESKKIAWRVASNFNRLATQGHIDLGKPPYGYRRVWVDQAGKVVHDGTYPPEHVRRIRPIPKLMPGDPEEVRVVKFIFEAYVERDMSLRDIGRELEQRGVQTPGGKTVWSQNCVGKILRDLKYAGYYVFNRRRQGKYYRLGKNGPEKSDTKDGTGLTNAKEDWRIVADSHEPLVSPELFALVQERMSANRTRTTPAPNRGDFLFSKLVVCGKCGSPMMGHRNGPGGEAFYRCGLAMGTAQRHCHNNLVKESELLDRVLDTLQSKLLNPDFIKLLEEEATKMDEDASSERRVRSLQTELETLDRDIARARGRLAKVDDETFDFLTGQIKGWVERRKELVSELGAANAPTHREQMQRLVTALRKYIWEFRDAVQSGDRQVVRASLRTLIGFVEVHVERRMVGPKKCKYDLVGGWVTIRTETGLSPLAEPKGRVGLKVPEGMQPVPSHEKPEKNSKTKSGDLSSASPKGRQLIGWNCSILVPNGRAA